MSLGLMKVVTVMTNEKRSKTIKGNKASGRAERQSGSDVEAWEVGAVQDRNTPEGKQGGRG